LRARQNAYLQFVNSAFACFAWLGVPASTIVRYVWTRGLTGMSFPSQMQKNRRCALEIIFHARM